MTGFATGDVTITGTAGGPKVATVTGSGTTYNVAVTGMTTSGTIIATIAAGVATDGSGNVNTASTSSDNSVTWESPGPRSRSTRRAGRPIPTNASPINYTVTFSEAVTNFVTGDVTFAGTSGGTKVGTVTGSGTTYNVAVTGMTTPGTVIATLVAGVATDAVGNASSASTSSDNTVTWDATGPTVTINQAVGQPDPDNTSPINYTVTFSESVTGFTAADVTLGGTAGGALAAGVTGSGTTYTVAVTGMTTPGTVTASVVAGAVTDALGNASSASTSSDNTVTWDNVGPSVTINQALAQADPTNTSPITFTVVFSEPVTGFTSADVTTGGTAGGAKTPTVTGSGANYTVTVAAITTSGTVTATILANRAVDAAGNQNAASTSTDNTVTWDVTGPTVTINQAGGQVDPTNTSPISFTVTFSEAVTGFTAADVTTGGTAGGTKTPAVSGSGATYTVTVTGMTTNGTVTASVIAGAVTDALGNASSVSTSSDNSVTWDGTAPTVTINQAGGQPDPDNTSPISFAVTFSESVTGFTAADVGLRRHRRRHPGRGDRRLRHHVHRDRHRHDHARHRDRLGRRGRRQPTPPATAMPPPPRPTTPSPGTPPRRP